MGLRGAAGGGQGALEPAQAWAGGCEQKLGVESPAGHRGDVQGAWAASEKPRLMACAASSQDGLRLRAGERAGRALLDGHAPCLLRPSWSAPPSETHAGPCFLYLLLNQQLVKCP